MPHRDLPAALLVGQPDAQDLASWLAATVVAFERQARDAVGPAQVLSSSGGKLVLALPYHRQDVLKGAIQMALRHGLIWSALSQWLQAVQAAGLAPNTLRFALAAMARCFPVAVLGNGVIQIGWGAAQQRMESSFTGNTSVLATRMARDKTMTTAVLASAGLPVPRSATVSDFAQAGKVAQTLGWPVVIKPSNRDQGQGVVPDIRTDAMLEQAFERAARLSPRRVIVEKHVPGDDHRMLVVGGRMMMATRRIPAGVVGDGEHTVAQLMEQVNADPRRGTGHRSMLKRLVLDDDAETRLAEQALTADSVLEPGRMVALRRTANISTGGTAVDVTAQVHPDNQRLAERAARVIGLDIAGVDLLCPDISRSWREVGAAICEVNAQPGFRPHWLGDPARDVNGEVIDWLFRDKPARIPTAAITGTNGKTTAGRMLHRIWMTAGRTAGVCTTHGVWVGDDMVTQQSLSGFPGGRMLLMDPAAKPGRLRPNRTRRGSC